MSKDKFIEKCMNLCYMSEEEIVKTILSDRLDNIDNGNEDKFPSDFTVSDIIKYKPTKNTFPDFAFFLCTSNINKKDLLKNAISNDFDNLLSEKRKIPHVETRRTRSRKKKLPSILGIFTGKDEGGVISDIETVIKEYFTDYFEISKSIYSDNNNNYVIVVSDSIDCRWKSNGPRNILTWTYPSDEYCVETFTNLININSTINIIRIRNGDLRYMGKCERIENMDELNGSCVMYVS